MLKCVIATMLFCASLASFGADFVAGKDYEVVKKSQTTDNAPGTVSVKEFFSFGCPWCYRLEPSLASWLKQQNTNIAFQKIPVVFNKDWEFYAEAYYASKALSLNTTMDPALFKTILDEKIPLNTSKAMIDFFVKHGVDEVTATSAFTHSPSIDLSVKEGLASMSHFHINAVPAFVVNNEYKTDLQMAKNETRLFEILDFLVVKSKEPKIAPKEALRP